MRYEPGTSVRREHLTSIAMVEGNEAHLSRVVIDDRVQEWVGFCWIDVTDTTTPAERCRLPAVL